MFQVAYEFTESWPKDGPLRVDAHFSGEITIPPEVARRRVNGYLGLEVALFMTGDEPMLILGERPIWRVPTSLRLRGFGKVAAVGAVDVDAVTGQVLPLSEDQINKMRAYANVIATHLTSPTDSTNGLFGSLRRHGIDLPSSLS